MLPFSFSACAKSVLGECNCRQPLGKRGCSLVATFGSPLMGFSISFIHPTSFQGTVWSTWSTKRITEVNGNKPIVLLHTKLALSSKHGGSLMGVPMMSLWISYDFGIPFPMRSTTGHPPICRHINRIHLPHHGLQGIHICT